jgi:hypothetical protein
MELANLKECTTQIRTESNPKVNPLGVLRGAIVLLLITIPTFFWAQINTSSDSEDTQPRYYIQYYLGIAPEEDHISFLEPRFEPYQRIEPQDRYKLEHYIAAFYQYPQHELVKVQTYYQGEHILTQFFDTTRRLERTEHYIRFFTRWNGFYGEPIEQTEIEVDQLRYHPTYYKVYYQYRQKNGSAPLPRIYRMMQYTNQHVSRSYEVLYDDESGLQLREYHEWEHDLVVSSVLNVLNDHNRLLYLDVLDLHGQHMDRIELEYPGELAEETASSTD